MDRRLRSAFVLLSVGALALVAYEKMSNTDRQRPKSPRPHGPVRIGLSVDQLKNTPDDQLEYFIFLAQIDAMGDNYDWAFEIVQEWPAGMRMLFATFALEGDVNNGGFNQYFWNSEGKFANMAAEGYRLVRADRYADIVERAISIYKQELKTQQKFKDRGTVDAFSESYKHTKLGALDDEFYKLKEDVSGMRVKYIRGHLDEFSFQSDESAPGEAQN